MSHAARGSVGASRWSSLKLLPTLDMGELCLVGKRFDEHFHVSSPTE